MEACNITHTLPCSNKEQGNTGSCDSLLQCGFACFQIVQGDGRLRLANLEARWAAVWRVICNATGKPDPPHHVEWYKDGKKNNLGRYFEYLFYFFVGVSVTHSEAMGLDVLLLRKTSSFSFIGY